MAPIRTSRLCTVALLFAASAQAQIDMPAPVQTLPSLQLQGLQQNLEPTANTKKLEFGDVSIVNSSPDLDEVDRVKRMSAQFPLRVILSGKGGDYYVADHLVLKQRGEVLADVSSAGPVLLFNLPSGNYELEAAFGDHTFRRPVRVTRSGITVNWVVPNSIN